MAKKASNKGTEITDELWDLVGEIEVLVKVRSALAFGSRSGSRDSAESVMSRQINSKVILLSEKLVSIFGKK